MRIKKLKSIVQNGHILDLHHPSQQQEASSWSFLVKLAAKKKSVQSAACHRQTVWPITFQGFIFIFFERASLFQTLSTGSFPDGHMRLNPVCLGSAPSGVPVWRNKVPNCSQLRWSLSWPTRSGLPKREGKFSWSAFYFQHKWLFISLFWEGSRCRSTENASFVQDFVLKTGAKCQPAAWKTKPGAENSKFQTNCEHMGKETINSVLRTVLSSWKRGGGVGYCRKFSEIWKSSVAFRLLIMTEMIIMAGKKRRNCRINFRQIRT